MAKTSTSFKPGMSGNPGGNPKDADISALARRYTVDAIRAFVEVARLTAPAHAAARVAAGRELVAIGYPGLGKGLTSGEGNALHLHLLAVTNHVAPGAHVHLTGEPAPVAPAIEAESFEPFEFAENSLPGTADDLPGEALPLWDAYKARKAAETARLTAENDDSVENQGESSDESRQPDGN